jgi:hypothetical protein
MDVSENLWAAASHDNRLSAIGAAREMAFNPAGNLD